MRWRDRAGAFAVTLAVLMGAAMAQEGSSSTSAPAAKAPEKPAAQNAGAASAAQSAKSEKSGSAAADSAKKNADEAAVAKKAAVPAVYTVLIDPAHGGSDSGAKLTGTVLERDVTLAFAQRVEDALRAKGLGVRATRSADADVTSAARDAMGAGMGACIALHATASGSGVHIFTAMAPVPDASGSGFIPWGMVQQAQVPRSEKLAAALKKQIGAAGYKVLVSVAAMPDLDGFNCPAVAVELAPATNAAGHAVNATDADYQVRVANAVAAAAAEFREGQRGMK